MQSDPLRGRGIQLSARTEDSSSFPRGSSATAEVISELVHSGQCLIRRKHRVDVESIEVDFAFLGIQYISELVDPEFLQNSSELLLEHLAHSELHRAF